MKFRTISWRSVSRLPLLLFLGGWLISTDATAVGTWVPLNNLAPDYIGMMLLLPDGTVMASDGGSNHWYRLTPDSSGSYVNGTWSTLSPMNDTRLYFASDVLRDGRIFIAGGEYGTGTATAEVYNPLSNTWTRATVPLTLLNPSQPSPAAGGNQAFADAISAVLPNGNVMIAPVYSRTVGGTLIYNSTSNAWSAGPDFFRVGYPDQAEASWVKLADGSILTVDPFGTNSERYVPSLNRWINDAHVPVSLYDTNGELGAALLLSDGRALFLGGTGHTAIYTPTGTTNLGSWATGPELPDGQGASDAPAAMLVNGKILCATGPAQTFNPPVSFYEYDPAANSFTAVDAPDGSSALGFAYPFATTMLDLPDGSVLFTYFDVQLYVYQPDGSPLATGKPGINSITPNADGSYHLSGTKLNGISQGAAYGDDAQMDSNYPIVRMTNSTGNVFYARTSGWSSTGVMTGNTPVTTEFTLPPGLPVGKYSLVVVANGNSSDPVAFVTLVPLQIALSGGKAVLTWPSSATNAVLETTTNLSSGSWTMLTNGVALVSTNFVLTNSLNSRSAFYRLSGR
ncbi:MAG TPA: kelch repeat-containing protein [Verrucomicrobiae bacterium]|nr:kelch repeat-containing protein [Verrucomicrobiae bacterium]